MSLDSVRARLLKLVRQRDTDLKHASLAIGRNAAYLHQFIFRGTPKVLPSDSRSKLAKFLDTDESLLRHRTVPPRKPRSRSSSGRRERTAQVELPGFVPVPEIDIRASAGAGALHDGVEETKETWLFPEAIVRYEFGATPEHLRMIKVDGDSMEPLLSSGDRILIDTSQRLPAPPGVFAIWDGMGLVTKRVEHMPQTDPARIVIKSINPDYQTYERPAEEVSIIGRVVWVSKKL